MSFIIFYNYLVFFFLPDSCKQVIWAIVMIYLDGRCSALCCLSRRYALFLRKLLLIQIIGYYDNIFSIKIFLLKELKYSCELSI